MMIEMNSDEIAIKVNNLSKIYRIGVKDQIKDSFTATLMDFLKGPFKKRALESREPLRNIT